MKRTIEDGFSLNDLLIRPNYSSLESRKEVNLDSKISNINLELPIISAPMSSITESDMAVAMRKMGGLGIIHRYIDINAQALEVAVAKESAKFVAAAINTGRERADALIAVGADALVMDIAHGWSLKAMEFLENLRNNYPDIILIGGNITEPDAMEYMAEIGINGARIGIGEGSACTTREVAGVGAPLATVLDELNINRIKEKLDFSLLVDGGVHTTGNMVKCLALGADAIITGSLLAGTSETPGPIRKISEEQNDGTWKTIKTKSYFGMASIEAMNERAERDSTFDYDDSIHTSAPEGKSRIVPFIGPARYTLNEIKSGLKIGFSYVGASNIEELRRNAKFITKGG